MGNCFQKPPINAEAKENQCCDNLDCPSSCCVIIITRTQPENKDKK